MSTTVIAGIIGLILLMVTGIPVAFSFMGAALIMSILGHYNTSFMVASGFAKMSSITLLAMPMYILAGSLMEFGGIGSRIVNFTNRFVGHIRGGLTLIAILCCGIFGAITGSGDATISCIGSILRPKFEEKKYPAGVVAALMANAGIIGMLIPPSILMILYAWAAEVSVLACFLSTVISGLMVIVLFSVISLFLLRNDKDVVVMTREEIKETLRAQRFNPDGTKAPSSVWAMFMPVIILGGIYSGLFTATEAAAVSCIYAIPVGMLIYKELNGKALWSSLRKAFVTSGIILITSFGTTILSRIFVDEKLPQTLIAILLAISSNRFVQILLINLFLVIIGMLMSDTAAILLVTPILVPVIKSIGMDPIQFAAIIAVNLGFGNVTPPCAPKIYLSARVMNAEVPDMWKPNMAYLIFGWLPTLLVVSYIPAASMLLPKLIMGYGG
ncbi:MAG: TRAP transporter large permease [Lachnospiraceae bacterium]|nr:TRAP transporter large permease [Lachnospiraceae bacterium]